MAPHYLEHKALVRWIFDLLRAGEYEPFTSTYATDEARRLVALYIQEKAISPAYTTDAAHIAITAVNGLDFIVSLNFTHIARPWTIEKVRLVNGRENYKGIGIYRPGEVLEIYEDGAGILE
jgi:hypothetical protein